MKLITAIVNKKDTYFVCDALSEAGFFFTKISSSGGFLRDGNVTLLIGVEDEQLEKALDVIRKHCSQRTELVPSAATSDGQFSAAAYIGAEVIVGGATVFVTNVEHFEKM